MRSDCCESRTQEVTQDVINSNRAFQGKAMIVDHFGSDCLEDGEYTYQELIKLALLNLMHMSDRDSDLDFNKALVEAQAEFKQELVSVGREI